jgi:hypothetical protein
VTTTSQASPATVQAGKPEKLTSCAAARLVPPAAAPAAAIPRTGTGSQEHSPARPARAIRSWPLLILALPAAVAVWSGWVGIGQLTGFGQIHPLPGIWNSLHLNTAITLPVGVEAYAAYALRAWLTASIAISDRTRRFARRSATGSLLLGMAGQAGYHLLVQDHITRAPWPVTTAVSCLPVLVLGMGTALAHLLRADTATILPAGHAGPGGTRPAADHADHGPDYARTPDLTSRLAQAQTAAAELTATGRHVSRRALRTAGLHGSNADLGALARMITTQARDGTSTAGHPQHLLCRPQSR